MKTPAMDWCHLDKRKSKPWTEQLAKLRSRLGMKNNTPEGRSILWNADKLTLSRGLLYYRYKPKYQIKEVKCFDVPRMHRRTAIDGCHHDTGHQGMRRTESLISDQFWWPGVFEDVRTRVFCCVNANKIPFQGVKHEMGLQSALKSSHCQTTKTIRPAVEKLHCCITEVDSIQCFTNSPLTEPN